MSSPSEVAAAPSRIAQIFAPARRRFACLPEPAPPPAREHEPVAVLVQRSRRSLGLVVVVAGQRDHPVEGRCDIDIHIFRSTGKNPVLPAAADQIQSQHQGMRGHRARGGDAVGVSADAKDDPGIRGRRGSHDQRHLISPHFRSPAILQTLAQRNRIRHAGTRSRTEDDARSRILHLLVA